MPWNANGTFSLAQTFGTGVAPDNQFPPKVGNTLDDLASGLNIGTIFSFSSTIAVTFATVTASVVTAGAAVIGSPTGGTISSAVNASSYYANSVAVTPNIPQNQQDANYTLVITDAQKHLYHSSATSHAWTIPANSSVAFPVGTAVSFVNDGTGTVTIPITTDTLKLAGTAGATGTRTLKTNGMATALKMTTTSWIISGSALS